MANTMNLIPRLVLALTACVAASASAELHPAGQGIAACTAAQLSFATDSENGNFDGMSHSGTLLVLRNLGSAACTLQAFPAITFSDAKGALKVTFTTPGSKFMHPGPVMVPAIIAAGAEATSSLRWVSAPVYDPGICLSPTSIAIQIGTEKVQTALSASLCGPNAGAVGIQKTRFSTDPVYSSPAEK